jgi:phosphoheptose isomerase
MTKTESLIAASIEVKQKLLADKQTSLKIENIVKQAVDALKNGKSIMVLW